MRLITLLLGSLLGTAACGAEPASHNFVEIAGGDYASVLKIGEDGKPLHVPTFHMMDRPVSNADFLAFVQSHPQWQRDRTPSIFVDSAYLSHWPAADLITGQQATQPVTRVSWFAASAYCASKNARLPSWSEWEYAAAADETRRDARDDPAWRERILGWYSRPSTAELETIGSSKPNVYGVYDLHGMIWEWVDDYNALFVAADSRKQGDPDLLQFCGAGAISMDDRENYAVLMRIALLSSLDAHSTTRNLGFRCVRD